MYRSFFLLFLFFVFIPQFAEANTSDTHDTNKRSYIVNEYRLNESIPMELDLLRFRQAYSEFYETTGSPGFPVRLPAEFEPVEGVFFAWEITEPLFYCDLARRTISETNIYTVIFHHGEEEKRDICECLSRINYAPLDAVFMIDLSKIEPYFLYDEDPLHEEMFFQTQNPRFLEGRPTGYDSFHSTNLYNLIPLDRSLDSDWIRDWGPFFVEKHKDEDVFQAIVGFRYDIFRVNDDAMPSKMANLLNLPAYVSSLEMDGGSLVTDGLGTCFLSWPAEELNDLHSIESIEQELGAYLGCRNTIWLHPLDREPTGHVDVFLMVADQNLVLVGYYAYEDDPKNSLLLDYNASVIAAEFNSENEPFEVIRVPMPGNSDGVFRTYLNSLVLNEQVIVPVFSDDRDHEESALALFAGAFPEKAVVTIDAESMISRGGAVRCATTTRPAQQDNENPGWSMFDQIAAISSRECGD